MKSQKGFTLIELLVVVAIIGILAATILAALGGARAKARLSRAQSELSSLRAAMELHYNENSYSYAGGLVSPTSGAQNLVDSISKYVGNSSDAQGYDSVNTWSFYFKAPDGKIYCADSNGYAGKDSATSIPSSDTPCSPAI